MRVHPIMWLTWLLVFVALESMALLNRVPNDTLTQTVVSYVPGWALFMGWGWLAWHFIMSYLSRTSGKPGR